MIDLSRTRSIQPINKVDETIDIKTFRFIMDQLMCICLDILLIVILVYNSIRGTINHKGILVDVSIGILVTLYLIYSRLSYLSSIKKTVKENKGIMYSSKSVSISEGYVYINGIRPIKVKILE